MTMTAILKKFNTKARRAEHAPAIAQSFTRCFQSRDGQIVLEHLYQQTLGRVTDPVTHPDHLRFLEGQRQLVLWMAQMTEKGKASA